MIGCERGGLPHWEDATMIKSQKKARTAVPGLQVDINAAPRGHWEGHLVGLRGASADCKVFVQAEISFTADIVDGEGRAPGFGSSRKRSASRFAIAGRCVRSEVDIQLWFEDADFARTPFACAGRLSHDERVIEGEWSFDCLYPDTCNCGGGGGTFELHKVG
jgi:hypothetical protein